MSKEDRPILTVFAGPNGAGKSTLREDMESSGIDFGPEIDPDAIARQIVAERASGNVGDADIMREAGRDAINQMKDHIAKRESFSRETTLSGKEPLRMMRQAKEAGFVVDLIYVGVENLSESMNRVRQREKRGGHGIPEDAQERRFVKSLDNAPKAAEIVDRVDYYHNGNDGHEHMARAENGKLAYRAEDAPEWVSRATAGLEASKGRDLPATRQEYIAQARKLVEHMSDGPGKAAASGHLDAIEQGLNLDRDDDFEIGR